MFAKLFRESAWGGGKLKSSVVALLRLLYQALLLKGISQVAVGIGEVGLQLNGPPISVHGQVDEPLLIIHAGQVSMHHSMVGGQIQCSQVCSYSSVKNSCLLQHVTKINVGV
eukprot:TRINITY_DN9730_c0_g1_i2.p2 TRINITY_DN9730_c0_g1~~TRINITY_DN9730_c0_g1_i2.p2  ORF type:complete len:112 (+),score=8.27 TRINITY_DN9730_c0_g1_i2:176-511(+)